ncbi:MAG: hypothetical protein ACFFCV_07180 [Promethearchaeota archaeon]
MNKVLKEDLRFTIERANEIVRLLENRRYKFLEINLALVTAFSFLLVYILDNFNIAGKLSMLTSISIYFVFTMINIGYNLKENRTLGIRKSLCSYRDWNYKDFMKFMENINENLFEDDYKDQIENLYEYQMNYNKIGKNTRLNTFTGLIILFFTFSISLIINSLINYLYNYIDPFKGYELRLDCFGIFATIFLYNGLPSLVIWGIIWWRLKWKGVKEEREETELIKVQIPKGKVKEYKPLIYMWIEEHKAKNEHK